MFHRVLQQLGQRHGEWGGHVRGHIAQVAGGGDHNGLRRHHGVLRHLDERHHDLGERHLVARVPREDLVDERNRPYPALCLLEGDAGRPFVHSAGLEAQE